LTYSPKGDSLSAVSSVLPTLRGLPRLVSAGTAVVVIGAAGDFIFHLSNGTQATALVGPDGYRAHLVTFAGMVISVVGLISRALTIQRNGGTKHPICPSVHS
jgi:hypothetical protein